MSKSTKGMIEKMPLKFHSSLTLSTSYEIELCAPKIEHKGSMINNPTLRILNNDHFRSSATMCMNCVYHKISATTRLPKFNRGI